EQLVRLVPARRVLEWPVDHLLQDEVPPGVAGQVRLLQQQPEVTQVAVQVAPHQHVGGAPEGDDPAGAPGGVAEGLDGPAEGGEQTVGVRHGRALPGSGPESGVQTGLTAAYLIPRPGCKTAPDRPGRPDG